MQEALSKERERERWGENNAIEIISRSLAGFRLEIARLPICENTLSFEQTRSGISCELTRRKHALSRARRLGGGWRKPVSRLHRTCRWGKTMARGRKFIVLAQHLELITIRRGVRVFKRV